MQNCAYSFDELCIFLLCFEFIRNNRILVVVYSLTSLSHVFLLVFPKCMHNAVFSLSYKMMWGGDREGQEGVLYTVSSPKNCVVYPREMRNIHNIGSIVVRT